eukprot:284814707_4
MDNVRAPFWQHQESIESHFANATSFVPLMCQFRTWKIKNITFMTAVTPMMSVREDTLHYSDRLTRCSARWTDQWGSCRWKFGILFIGLFRHNLWRAVVKFCLAGSELECIDTGNRAKKRAEVKMFTSHPPFCWIHARGAGGSAPIQKTKLSGIVQRSMSAPKLPHFTLAYSGTFSKLFLTCLRPILIQFSGLPPKVFRKQTASALRNPLYLTVWECLRPAGHQFLAAPECYQVVYLPSAILA